MKVHKITFRADGPLFNGIKAMAEKRGMTMSDYVRMMASLELMELRPEAFKPLQQDMKELLADMQEFSELEPGRQVDVLRRNVEAITNAKRITDEAFRGVYALLSALDAYTNSDKPPKGQP
jgi:antitoxin component of RelBE/YafQ-DinJ toxin-antitoxin module